MTELGNGWNVGLKERKGRKEAGETGILSLNLPAAPALHCLFHLPFSLPSTKLLLDAAASGNRQRLSAVAWDCGNNS